MTGKSLRRTAALLTIAVTALISAAIPAMAAGENGSVSDIDAQGLSGIGDWWEEQTEGDGKIPLPERRRETLTRIPLPQRLRETLTRISLPQRPAMKRKARSTIPRTS